MVEVYGDICMLFAWAYFGKSPYLIQTRNPFTSIGPFSKAQWHWQSNLRLTRCAETGLNIEGSISVKYMWT